MEIDPEGIAAAFMKTWENAWNNDGIEAVLKLYAPDSVVVGNVLAVGKLEMTKLFEAIFDQGWSKIKVNVTNAREVGGLVLVANEYSAFGSGPNEGKTLDAKSSFVLALVGGSWLSVMHTAT